MISGINTLLLISTNISSKSASLSPCTRQPWRRVSSGARKQLKQWNSYSLERYSTISGCFCLSSAMVISPVICDSAMVVDCGKELDVGTD